MDFIKTQQAALMKAAGSKPVVYRSEDYPALASGSSQVITFTRETSSLILHNRSDVLGTTNILFYLDGTDNTPIQLIPGESITINKGWADTITLIPTASSPVWQIIVTL